MHIQQSKYKIKNITNKYSDIIHIYRRKQVYFQLRLIIINQSEKKVVLIITRLTIIGNSVRVYIKSFKMFVYNISNN